MATGSFAPLAHREFRRIWWASLFSNFGLLINAVAASWAMTTLSGRAQDVALVQTALMAPYMLFAMGAGAIADTYDKRRVAIVMSLLAAAVATTLALCGWAGMMSPTLLLVLCFLLGTANAMFGPAWQSAVAEQVPAAHIGGAVALNSVSYNIARSFGPALGGAIVAAAGPVAAFATTACCYLPIVAALLIWRRTPAQPRLPPERIGWAVLSGVRYVLNAPPIRTVLVRSLIVCTAGGSVMSLTPLVARDLIGGAALDYGVLLGAFGLGAVTGALLLRRLERHLPVETLLTASALVMAAAIGLLPFARTLGLATPLLYLAGIGWMQLLTAFNIGIQTGAPRWVAGRALAAYQAATAGGIAIGGILWGAVAQTAGVAVALGFSAAALFACALLGRWMRLAPASDAPPGGAVDDLPDPDVALALTGRSGPIAVEIVYRIPSHCARAFYIGMLDVRRIRRRSGGYGWSLARDVADVQLWSERFSCPTWHDYLRQRNRLTPGERALAERIASTAGGGAIVAVRRLLERPLGSVRWQAETPDPAVQGSDAPPGAV